MKEQELHKLIRENSSNDNTDLADALKKNHPELMQDAAEKAPHKKSAVKRALVIAPIAAAAVAVAVLIPVFISDDDGDMGASSSPPIDYRPTALDCTVYEYNQINGTDFLCFDDKDISDCEVVKYTSTDYVVFKGLGAELTYTVTDDFVEYVICPENKPLDFLERNIAICDNEGTVSDIPVKWTTVNYGSYGIFNYDGYDYYLTVKDADKERLFELIDVLLPPQE